MIQQNKFKNFISISIESLKNKIWKNWRRKYKMRFTWSTVLIAALLSFFLIHIYYDFSITYILIGVTLITMLIDVSSNKFPKELFFIIICAFFMRLVLMFIDTYSIVSILPNGGNNPENFQRDALIILQTGRYSLSEAYPSLLAVFYYFFGNQIIIGKYINLLLSMEVILIVNRLLNYLNISEKTKKISLLLLAFLPNFAILSVVLRRESLIIYLLTLSLYFFIRWLSEKKNFFLVLAILLGLFSSIFHSGTIVSILCYGLFLVFYDNKTQKIKIKFDVKSIAYLTLMIGLFIIISQSGNIFLGKFSNVESVDGILQQANESAGGSGYYIDISTGNAISDFIVNSPVRVFYYLLSPLPWQWRGIPDILAFIFSGSLYTYILFTAIKERNNISIIRRKEFVLLYLTSILSTFVFAWGVSNAGTALRHRDKFIATFILLFAIIKDEKTHK